MINLINVSLQRGLKTLIQESNLSIYAGQKLGLVGKNGCGKSSLFAALLGQATFDGGEYRLPNGLQIAHIEQEMPDTAITALEYAAQGHQAYADIQRALEEAQAAGDDEALMKLYNDLSEIDGYTIPSTAAKILVGLGFTQSVLDNEVKSFSGGWRMRLNLARVLISTADFILLDEPTNHLDLEAIVWLENWIQQSPATVVVISHDRQFLDAVTTHIVHIEHQTLKSYTGNYSSFENQRAEHIRLNQATFAKQEKQRAHLSSFVERFRYTASKAKQAQSRLKMLEKLDASAPLRDEAAVHFQFKPTTDPGSPMLSGKELAIGYQADSPILNNVSFTLNNFDRIGLIGPNGAGKSTFIKLLAEQLTPFSGDYHANNKIKVGYFAQHLMDQLDIRSNALQLVLEQNDKLSDGQARKILGRYKFNETDIFRPISSFSGGERARLVLALIIEEAPNLLLLDEPTNHLDLEVRDALNSALQVFEGATIIVSHDRFFLSSVSDQLWLVYGGEVKPFDGSIEQYQKWYSAEQKRLLQETEKSPEKSKTSNHKSSQSRKTQVTRDLKKAEEDLEQKLFELDELHQQLAQASEDNEAERLIELSQKNNKLETIVLTLEEKILKLMEQAD